MLVLSCRKWTCVLAAVLAIGSMGSAARAEDAIADMEWPMHRRDGANTGHSPARGCLDSTPEVLWHYDTRAWRGTVVVSPGERDSGSLRVRKEEPVPVDSGSYSAGWKRGQRILDITGRGNLSAVSESNARKWGKILPNVPGYQKVEIKGRFADARMTLTGQFPDPPAVARYPGWPPSPPLAARY